MPVPGGVSKPAGYVEDPEAEASGDIGLHHRGRHVSSCGSNADSLRPVMLRNRDVNSLHSAQGTEDDHGSREALAAAVSRFYCCCCFRKNFVPFCVVVGSTAAMFFVPLFTLCITAALVAMSFWPVIVFLLPFFAAGWLLTIIALVILAWFLRNANGRQAAKRYFKTFFWFLLPFHGLFATVVVACFSFWWSLAIGACLFIQGEVLWSRAGVVRRSQRVIDFFEAFAQPLLDYFPLELRASKAFEQSHHLLEAAAPAIFAYHPHGIYCFGLHTLVMQNGSGLARILPWKSNGTLVGVASALLHLPVVGTLFSYFGFIPASRECLDEACETDYDVALVPGGIAEMMLPGDDSTKERLYIKNRHGFIRMALKHGRTIVPCYGFGENDVLKKLPWFQGLRRRLSRQWKVSIALFRGQKCTLMPFRIPITVVLGRPLQVPKVAEDAITPALVNAYLEKYLVVLREVFEENKHCHPTCKERELELE